MWKSFDVPMCHGDGDHPFETCLSFGELAEYFDEIGIGRLLTQDEAIEMVEGCMDAGMVPESLSMKDVDILCMCHGDCCGNLSALKAKGGAVSTNVNISAYVLKYDAEKCIQCGACVNRCPMEAISFTGDDSVLLHNNACVRCGQCVTVCPADARILAYRGDYPELGRDYIEAVEQLAVARMRRGKITDFAGGEVAE
jgi:ferredoxin